MLNAVSQINTNQRYYLNKTIFKSNQFKVTDKKDVFQKDSDQEQHLTKQQKRFLAYYIGYTIAFSALIGAGVGIYKSKNGMNFFTNSKNFNFQSLKNEHNIPTLDNCKSLNKELKQLLQRQLNFTKVDRELLEEIGKPNASNRILLSGPSGNGKTYFSKVYAKTLDAEYMEVMFSDLSSRWVGEIEGKMSSMFNKVIKQAKKNPDKKYVLTFNEIDSMITPIEHLTGGNGSTHFASLRRQRSTFLTYLDKIQNEVPNVTIIGTTNLSTRSKNLDSASMSRFQNVMEISYPDKDCLYEAMKMGLVTIKNKDKFLSENDDKLKNIAKTMADRKYSFRNLENILNEAKIEYLEEKINNKTNCFNFKYIENAQKNLKTTDGEKVNIKK